MKTREELLELIAYLTGRLQEAEADRDAWVNMYMKLKEAMADVPGVSHVSAPAGVPECAGAGT